MLRSVGYAWQACSAKFKERGRTIKVPCQNDPDYYCAIDIENEFLSFEKIGLLKQLEKESKLMPSFIKEAEIAKKMKAEGLSLELISKVTGLSLSEIRVLTRKRKDETS